MNQTETAASSAPVQCVVTPRAPFTPEEILGSETPGVLKLVNRLYSLGAEIRTSDDLSEALAECVEVLQCRIAKGEDDALSFAMAAMEGFTIRELQEMNRDGVPWVMGVLFAVVECGVETARHQEARLVQRVCRGEIDGEAYIDLEFWIRETDGSGIGRIALARELDGSCKWVSTARLREAEWGVPAAV